jgi:hypothetical protein
VGVDSLVQPFMQAGGRPRARDRSPLIDVHELSRLDLPVEACDGITRGRLRALPPKGRSG